MSNDAVFKTSDISIVLIAVVPAVAGLIALLMACMFRSKVMSSPMGNELMNTISGRIKAGAKSFLRTEYKYLSIFVVIFAIFLCVVFETKDGARSLDGVKYAGAFLGGAILSAAAGWFGMIIATDSNVRTAQAASSKGLNAALQVAFAGGSVMGFVVVGLGLFGLSIFFLLMFLGKEECAEGASDDDCLYAQLQGSLTYVVGFGFGASSIALFARVAGGIYTKAADVGGDLVGKFENGLDEDSPNNPAVIADNVGDNVGDVAGMGADLFESYVGSIIAAATMSNNSREFLLPFWIPAAGILASIIGSCLVKTKDRPDVKQSQLMAALNRGLWTASFLSMALNALIIYLFFGTETHGWKIFGTLIIGVISGVAIGEFTEYSTSYAHKPTTSIADAGLTGSATVVIQGLGIGMLSCLPPVLTVCIVVVACNILAGEYGIGIAAVGMLSTLGISLATDAYGPVADNAGGIAEMAELPKATRAITDALDALGNTTAATGKGHAIGSAVLTALSLLASFKNLAGVTDVQITEPIVLAGIILGAVLPYLFAALTMLSVRKAAGAIIAEVRRQFRTIPGLRENADGAEPDSDRCVAISTQASVEEMIIPGTLAIFMPITIGFLVGPRCLIGLLTGAISSGFMLAVMMSNAGGAWDNAKKYIEIEGAYGGKRTDVHNACVVGDTVGDPFKDTSGPALNILIKLMSMVSLVIAPLLSKDDWADWQMGLIPFFLMIIIVYAVYAKFWKTYVDPAKAQYDAAQKGGAAVSPAPEVELAEAEKQPLKAAE